MADENTSKTSTFEEVMGRRVKLPGKTPIKRRRFPYRKQMTMPKRLPSNAPNMFEDQISEDLISLDPTEDFE